MSAYDGRVIAQFQLNCNVLSIRVLLTTEHTCRISKIIRNNSQSTNWCFVTRRAFRVSAANPKNLVKFVTHQVCDMPLTYSLMMTLILKVHLKKIDCLTALLLLILRKLPLIIKPDPPFHSNYLVLSLVIAIYLKLLDIVSITTPRTPMSLRLKECLWLTLAANAVTLGKPE